MRTSKPLNWPAIVVLVASPLAAAACLVLYIGHHGFHVVDLACLLLMTTLTGLAITAGYHRYYAHRTYRCHPVVQLFYLLFGAAALQSPMLKWVSEHRDHHRHVDRDGDPYCATKGFFFAHVGWICYADSPPRSRANVADLEHQPFVRMQQRWHVPLGLAIGMGLPFAIGLLVDRPWGGVLWGGLLRTVVAHHGTFLVNSAGHYFGRQPYSRNNSSRDSALLALLTLGEGFHNFHHAFPGDYRNGLRWYQWDPTKWWIALLAKLGLATKLKRTPERWIAGMRAEAPD